WLGARGEPGAGRGGASTRSARVRTGTRSRLRARIRAGRGGGRGASDVFEGLGLGDEEQQLLFAEHARVGVAPDVVDRDELAALEARGEVDGEVLAALVGLHARDLVEGLAARGAEQLAGHAGLERLAADLARIA